MMSRRMGSLCARFSGAGRALLRCRAYTAWKVLLRGQTDEVETETGPLLLLERAARLRDKVCKKKPALQDQWDEAGVESVDLVVRGMSGEIVLEECAAESQTPIKQLVQKIRALMDMEVELVQLCSGTTVLKHNGFFGRLPCTIAGSTCHGVNIPETSWSCSYCRGHERPRDQAFRFTKERGSLPF